MDALCVSALAVLLLLPLAARAQSVPPLVNYQGRLSNPDGSPLPTADYQLTFNIYDSATNSAGLVWGPQIFDGSNGVPGHGPKIPVVQGYFNVMLGPTDTNGASLANAFNDTNRFVEIKVETNKAISPRQQILTAPFAFNSARLAGADWSAVFGTNDPYNGKIPGVKLADGAITAQLISSNTITADRLALTPTGSVVPVGGIAISPSSGDFSSSTYTPPVAINNFSLAIATRGNPVEVWFADDGSTNDSFFGTSGASGTPITWLTLMRDGVQVGYSHGYVGAGAYLELPAGSFRFLDPSAPARTNNYTVLISGNGPLRAYYIRMMAREL